MTSPFLKKILLPLSPLLYFFSLPTPLLSAITTTTAHQPEEPNMILPTLEAQEEHILPISYIHSGKVALPIINAQVGNNKTNPVLKLILDTSSPSLGLFVADTDVREFLIRFSLNFFNSLRDFCIF